MLLALYSDRENQFQYKWFNNETDFNSSFAFQVDLNEDKNENLFCLANYIGKQLMKCKRQKSMNL